MRLLARFFAKACKWARTTCSPSVKRTTSNEIKKNLLVVLSAGLVLGCDPSDGGASPATETDATPSSSDTGGTDSQTEDSTTAAQGTDDAGSENGSSSSDGGGSSEGGSSSTGTDGGVEDGTPYDPGAPSCEGLETECAGASCCTTVNLPAGTVAVGRGPSGDDACPKEFSSECFSRETPEHDVAIDGFALDHYAVTVGRFRAFVTAWEDSWRPAEGDGEIPGAAGSGWQPAWNDYLPDAFDLQCNASATWTETPGSDEDKPIGCVNWYQAQAFCLWDGGRLPTEAEWEYAAAGAEENRLYPWGGEAIDETRSVYDTNTVEPVGTKPDGAARWGHMDMAGNTSEWVFDCLDDDFFETPEASADNAVLVPSGEPGETPCGNNGSTDPRVLKGGGTSSSFLTYNRVASRDEGQGDIGYGGITFRCARGL